MVIDPSEQLVLEDLNHLSQTWGITPTRTENLRRASSSLRGLLIDNGGSLATVARDNGIDIQVSAPVNEQTICKIKGYDEAYLCGNTEIGGFHLAHPMLLRGNLQPPDVVGEYPDERRLYSLSEFKKQTCAMWYGVEVSRETLIKYVANKLGGNHYDTRRAGKLGLEFIALDQVRKKTSFMEVDGVYFELLATGRFLTESDAVMELMTLLDMKMNS